MFGQLVIIRQSFNPLLSGSVFLTSACVCSSEDIAKCFNPLLSGSVFLTFMDEYEEAWVYRHCGFNPLLSGSVFLTRVFVFQQIC